MQDRQEERITSLVNKALQSIRQQERVGYAGNSQRMEHAPVVALVNQLIDDAIEAGASDIHLEPADMSVRIRFRIDGGLYEMHEPLPLQVNAFLVSRIKIMGKMDIMERRLPQDGRILYPYRGQNIDIRVSTMPIIDGENVVLRLLNISHRFLDAGELAFSQVNAEFFHSLCYKPNGLLLVTGPVNSGKTTCLYAALHELDSKTKNIVTIEDPVEYRMQGINQIQVNSKADLTFAIGLRSILRLDPDIIMVGEIRDEETADIAVRAALTGHLLFTTLHAGDSIHAIFRLIDMGVVPYLLSASLTGIIAQRLVRCICPDCVERYCVEKDSREAIFLGDMYMEGVMLYRGKGCSTCHYTGYQGRIAIHEILVINNVLRQAILEQKTMEELEILASSAGMISMRQDGVAKALAGKTTLEEIGRVLYGEI